MYTYANGNNNVYEVLPYSLPVLHMGKTCYVDFFCLDPIIGKMRRKKYHLDKFKTVAEKKARGAEISEYEEDVVVASITPGALPVEIASGIGRRLFGWKGLLAGSIGMALPGV
ncbi:MAG: chromate transporter, partial [Bacteroidaceae bacterium]|nr:chromate transporter [Bacteroidaceae bacterium]